MGVIPPQTEQHQAPEQLPEAGRVLQEGLGEYTALLAS